MSKVAANRYCRPCSLIKVTMSSAMAPVAADIMPGRPPAMAMMTAMLNEAYRPTLGSTPPMTEKLPHRGALQCNEGVPGGDEHLLHHRRACCQNRAHFAADHPPVKHKTHESALNNSQAIDLQSDFG